MSSYNLFNAISKAPIPLKKLLNLKYDNPILDKWKDKYNVHYLNGHYSNCNYQKKDKSKDIEVLISNY